MDIWYEHEQEVVEVDDHCEDAAYDHAGEDDTGLSDVEAVDWAICEREYLEEGVVDAVSESCVDITKQDRWILECDFERLDECVEGNRTRCEVLAVYLAL